MDYNFHSFHKALRATVVSNFYEAQSILDDINLKQITDPELYQYVEYCKELATYCIDYGIERNARPSFQSVLGVLKVAKIASKAFWDSVKDFSFFSGFAKFVGGGIKLKLELGKWFEIQETLLKRYQLDESTNFIN